MKSSPVLLFDVEDAPCDELPPPTGAMGMKRSMRAAQ